MCGIIAVVRRRQELVRPSGPELITAIDAAAAALSGSAELFDRLDAAATSLGGVDQQLRTVGGVVALVEDQSLASSVRSALDAVDAQLSSIEASLDAGEIDASVSSLERINARLIDAKDAAWAIGRDRLRAAEGVVELAGAGAAPSVLVACFSLHQALSAVDRLEVRGRDSAGIEILVSDHGIDLTDADTNAEIAARSDLLFKNRAVRVTDDYAAFVYKAAFEIGELGDNTAALRAAISEDELLRRALASPTAHALVLGHTRWASVGIISEPNAHPQSSDEAEGQAAEFVTAVLNGDVDNHADLIVSEELSVPGGVTTDAKVIPAMMARRLDSGLDAGDAFRETVTPMEGSVAIATNAASDVDRLFLALRGSGQALYVGLADDAYIVASEPYGVVEETSTYLRMDGETPSDPDNPTASRGQILELDATKAGSIEGITRLSYDGSELPIGADDLATAEITTRDIDRGDFPHYLLKEITDAPGSFRKTLRGKLLEEDGQLSVHLPTDSLPAATLAALADGSITRVQVIGQGTAAVAGQSLAHILAELVANTELRVEALPATELSGFRMRDNMSDTLIVAISQSGTTTDTNRTVDLVRGRGATVIAIVNRRNSDLCDKADGVLYTSDGRDVEMSVASTKAFYSQIAAGLLLASGIAAAVPDAADPTSADQQRLLAALRDLPDQLTETIARRDAIADAARTFAPSRRYWALVGNGSNQIAARELRIKMSELCYKSIACDATEDKKHIDLSAEPMIFVCAAGLVGSTADDVGKEVAIYRAHKAAPIVVATDGDNPFSSALAVLNVPDTDSRLAFVLSAMVGHLFGYEAALAIDAQARPLREARGVVEGLLDDGDKSGDEIMAELSSGLAAPTATFMSGLHANEYDGNLEAGTAVQVAAALRYATGVSVLDTYQSEFGKVGTPQVVLADLTRYLSNGIDELTRPVDAIKHQAKTVTVGISRSDESLFAVQLVADTFAAGAPRDRLSYATLKSLADLDAAVAEVTGYSRYRVENAASDDATAVVIDRGGIAVGIPSRTDTDPRLRGTKHLVARERELMVARGRKDGRMVLIVPETKDGHTTGLTLMHLQVHDRLPASTVRNVLSGYRRRYQALRDAVTETEDTFRDDLLADQPVEDLLCLPILDLADRWRS